MLIRAGNHTHIYFHIEINESYQRLNMINMFVCVFDTAHVLVLFLVEVAEL